MDVPNVVRNEYQLVNIDDGFLNLMDGDGKSKDDVKLPESEVGEQIQTMFDDGKEVLVTIVSAMGEEHALAVKEAPQGVSATCKLGRSDHPHADAYYSHQGK
jgi:translation initiation factor 5A